MCFGKMHRDFKDRSDFPEDRIMQLGQPTNTRTKE